MEQADLKKIKVTKFPEYTIWAGMKSRCYCTGYRWYKDYGGRGIKICDRWRSGKEGFLNFLADMGPRPTLKHSIDRIDNDGNYEPSNCRWATNAEQVANKRKRQKASYYILQS